MIITGIIPARYASTRFPGKPLILIDGKTMIQRVYEQAQKSKLLNQVVVATDSDEIFDCVNSFKGNAIMTSKMHKTGTDRICEVAQKIKSDIIVNIQGDEPFINPRNIDNAVKPLLKDKTLNVSTLAVELSQDFYDNNKVKVVFDKNNNALLFSRSLIPNNFKSIRKLKYYKHLGLYVYRKNFLLKFSKAKQADIELAESLEQLRILWMGEKIRVVLTKEDSISIDTKSDLRKIPNYIITRGK
ncbi:MAG: 3-deoxy-manno-octulosonate cytidylyltransferase [Ignavibacteriae bacterium]|nr:3-deoxy-manno-octulosonate cytidylyltransferase [Ignavibacteriota bacterium]